MSQDAMRVLVVPPDPETAEFARRVLLDHGDDAKVAEDVPDALNCVARDGIDVVLVSLSLPRGDGLALVHHLRALHPEVDVIVMANPSDLEESAHAMALGVLASVVLPLSGDGLLVAVDRARERRLLVAEKDRLVRDEAESRRRSATYARCAAFVAETDGPTVAARILDACSADARTDTGAVYLAALDGTRFHRVAALGDDSRFAASMAADGLGDLDPADIVHRTGDRVRILLVGGTQILGLVDLVPSTDESGGGELEQAQIESLQVIAALGTAALTAARKVEGIARSGIKDPETSAYTFAYFGDVAGREIDRAARHSRRFALLTVSIDSMRVTSDDQRSASDMLDVRRSITDALLVSVRDSDVVARVEDDELYVLLPETGLLGALAARHRMFDNLRMVDVAGDLDPAVGIAVYPSDGRDLGILLRASRRRADRSRRGVWRRLGLGRHSFWRAVERLLGTEDDAGLGRDGTVALHEDLRAAHDDASLARHAVMSSALVPPIASAVAGDAIAHRLPGSLYVAGDPAMAVAVGRAVDAADRPSLRAWALGPEAGPTEAAGRIHLAVDDPRLEERVLLLSLTELGGYALLARPLGRDDLLVYHSSDLDLVDGLVNALQSTYHLQPEVR